MTRNALRTPAALVEAGLLSPAHRPAIDAVARRFAIAIPAPLAALMDRDDPADPIARQYMPDARELAQAPGEVADPIGDRRHTPVEGIVHRYPDRVLLKVVHACPVYCRFCFRREMVGPGKEGNLSPAALDRALAYVARHPQISEVIVTGGDPFILAPHRVAALTAAIDAIGHVARVRWHTRVPVVDPQLITAGFAAALRPARAGLAVAVHANHPREFTPDAAAALARLREAGAHLLSQSVLLKGVNDDADTLCDLLDAFAAQGITPYYLHHGDLAPGTAHFRTTIAAGRALMAILRTRRPASDLPAYVLDIPGGHSKANLMGEDAVQAAPGRWRLRDRLGLWHDYREST
jgi:lysine 2,3-aminomutase